MLFWMQNRQPYFADEPDKYYIGTKQGTSEVPAGRNAITAELEFYCADPFKYSVEEFTVNPTADDGKTFIVSYNGTLSGLSKASGSNAQ